MVVATGLGHQPRIGLAMPDVCVGSYVVLVSCCLCGAKSNAKTVSMTDERILGHLAQRFAVSEENLATEALTWLLRRSAAARTALVGLARTMGADVPDELTFIGQVGSADTGRPDVVGLDASSRERLLIEAKFAAALTDQQPGGYLKRLPADVDGMLLVVAPTVRLATFWVELLRAVPELAPAAPSPSAVPMAGVLSVKTAAHTTLALVSWRSLVSRVLDALRTADESLLARDAEQLLALTETMDSAAFAPLRPGDLATRTARQIVQLHLIIDAARRRIATGSPVAEPYGRRVVTWAHLLRLVYTQPDDQKGDMVRFPAPRLGPARPVSAVGASKGLRLLEQAASASGAQRTTRGGSSWDVRGRRGIIPNPPDHPGVRRPGRSSRQSSFPAGERDFEAR